ncbi:acetate--CoA ligase [Candidatus Protochlamydia phocaeensis]|uniref:acetate--CoA ligase n=1 Tax=Candidatus Protochlamydia phocaeensis TaxID=1414722 RepID=UPI0009ADE42C|nr:acetate--CoA ligase [Candidatus Protochlamydia phocaeensis]
MKILSNFTLANIILFSSLAASDSLFHPSEEFKKAANIQSFDLFEEAKQDREAFWAKQAENIHWFQKWDRVLEWNPPYAKWFVGGKLNACYNCLDVHMGSETRDKIALIWEGERGEQRTFTYAELYNEVNKFSHVLKSLGVQKGDRVAIYLPMVPEAAVAMLACARVGAVHMVVFGGFSSEALKDRILDGDAKIVITADGGIRKGGIVPLKAAVDEALSDCPSVEKVVVVKRTNQSIAMQAERDYWYNDLMQEAADYYPPEKMDAEDILFILYTSGTTGKPKGIIHTTGGYMVETKASMRWIFDVKPSDIYWCTADVGWITGHSYVMYGPLSNGMTQLIYEGALDWPERDRSWQLIEKHKITTLYTAPTAIRTFMKWGEDWLKGYDMSSLRLLGSVGEPINAEAWMWYYTNIGQEKCPIVDTWWQTETGSILIAPIPGLTPLKPGSATFPIPGIEVAILDEKGQDAQSGALVVTSPWPSMLRGIYKDPKRYEETYWKKWNGRYYFTGDGAKLDEDGYIWLLGRIDDIINVSGHRLGSIELESALVDHPGVAEAAVVAINHQIKGQGIAAFVSLKEGFMPNEELANILKKHIVKKIGAFARPEKILFVRDLPKTRSGKIMRRLLRDIAEGRVLGDMTTLVDPTILDELKKEYEEDGE